MSLKNQEKLRILIVEDNPGIAENIGDFLEARGHMLDFAMDGIGGLHLILTETYDVIVLDIMLPGMDGITLCRKLRESGTQYPPIIMLTARDTLSDKLEGFGAGADDYLVKPFALRELEARIYALTGRRRPFYGDRLCVGDLSLDLGTMQVLRNGKEISLNKACLTILKTLMEASPKVVSRQKIEFVLWGDMPPGSDSLRSHIYTLRRKIDKSFDRPMLQTVHGLGFKLVAADES